MQTLECAAGLSIAALTLFDVFQTVVVPGGAHGPLRMLRRLVLSTAPLGRRLGGGAIGSGFGPTVLLLAFVAWLLLLLLGFGLIAHGLREHFSPPLQGLGHALYVAGSAMATISVGDVKAQGVARGVAVAAAFCNLAVLTLLVTYLLEVQGQTADRDVFLIRVTTTAGRPPSALCLLERHGTLDSREELVGWLRDARSWCATVMQSHASHPSLIYFRSAGTEAGWPSALGTVLDLALLVEFVIDEPKARGPAVLLREQAGRLAEHLCQLLRLPPSPVHDEAEGAASLPERLRAAGWTVRRDLDMPSFLAARRREVACVIALSRHLGMPEAPLIPRSA